MDEMLEELALLRKELNAIGNNLNQAVRQKRNIYYLDYPETLLCHPALFGEVFGRTL